MTVSTLGFILIFALFVTSQCTCPEGHYKEKNNCYKCKDDTYMDMENSRHCFNCISCDSLGHQTEVKPCMPTQNRECGCKPGFYKSEEYGNDFFCKPCESCQNCTECVNCEECNPRNKFTTTTGVCRVGYFPDGGQCKECPKSDCESETCKSFCNKPGLPSHPDPLLLSVLIILVILGGLLGLLFIWFYRRRRHCWEAKNWLVGVQVQPDQPNDLFDNLSTTVRNDCNKTTIKPESGSPVNSCPHKLFNGDCQSMTPLDAKEDPKLMQILPEELWPAPVLYTIIKEIPVLRWKEFVRLLSVSDDQIERTELEAGPSYLEKQYMMLRLWCQSGGAKLENIYSTLHYMNLSGCAEELQEKLENRQLSVCEILTPSPHT